MQVQPAIKLPFVSKSGFFHFYVTAGTSFAGKTAFLQRYTLAKTWVNIRALTLGSQSGRLISVRFGSGFLTADAGFSSSILSRMA